MNPSDPNDAASDADRDGLTALEEFALRCHPLRRDTNGDGRTDGEEADEGVDPALDSPDWAAYGTGHFAVRVTGTQAARRAGVAIGHILHSGVAERTYALAAGTSYAVTVSDLDPDNIWEISSEAVTLGANTTVALLIEQSVVGTSPGTDTVSARVDHLWGAEPPQYSLTVYAPATPVPVHVMFVCDTNGNHAGSADDIPSLLAGVNYIYRQAGINFAQASVTYTNNQEWYQNSGNDVLQREIVNSRIATQGVEVYIVPDIATNVLGRNISGRGLLVINTASSYVLAHEIGHQCGLKDLYASRTNSPPVTGFVSIGRLPLDWNNGPGPEEYYLHGLPHTTLVRRLLMYGAAAGGVDIPAGSLYGLDTQGVMGLITVGIQGMNRTPQHNY